MKSQFQTLAFLSQYKPKSSLDSEMISSFLEKRFRITPKTIIFSTTASELQIDAKSFIQWFENGYGATEVARYNSNLVILGACTDSEASIEGTKTGDLISLNRSTVPITALTKCTEEETKSFQILLLSNSLQFSEESLTLVKKHIPKPNEKVIFYNHDYSIGGLGVVRNVNPQNYEVVLYCYFIYPTKTKQRRIGYSMHETGIVNLHEYIFEPMLEDDNRDSKLSGVSCLRRLNRELKKENKVWKDKIHRIEPSNCKVEIGEKYWYISDKMKVVQEIEKGTPTSQFRYLAGNYFKDHECATKMLGQFEELLRNYLASPEWPNVND